MPSGEARSAPDDTSGLPLWQAYAAQQRYLRRRQLAVLAVALLLQAGLAGYIVQAVQTAAPADMLPPSPPAAGTVAPLPATPEPERQAPHDDMPYDEAPAALHRAAPPVSTSVEAGTETGRPEGDDARAADEPAAPLRLHPLNDGSLLLSPAGAPARLPRGEAPLVLLLERARDASLHGDWDQAGRDWARLLAAEPDRPDHAYNLAVSLDRTQRREEAVHYYRMALSLAAGQPYRFPHDAAVRRLAALEAGL